MDTAAAAAAVLMIPSPAVTVTPSESASTSPYITAPSSPHHRRPADPFYSAPASPTRRAVQPDDFAFDFSGELERNSLPADELFDGGIIRPLSRPPLTIKPQFQKIPSKLQPKNHLPGSTRPAKTSRSLSPVRVSDLLLDPEPEPEPEQEPDPPSWYKKWRISDLFRSASESRAIDEKRQRQKYAVLKKPRHDEGWSSRSTDRVGSVSSRRMRSVHYTANRANAEEMKRRTFLPYRQGLLGCLPFHHPPVSQLYTHTH